MKRGLDWYKREPQAFLDGVQGMGPELIGAYAVLLDLIYARGGETRRDDHHLAGVMGCSKRKATSLTDQLIERKKIIVEGDFITNSVAKSTAKSRRNLSEVRAEAGRAGGIQSGRSRKNNDLDEAPASSKKQPEKRREEKNTPLSPQGGQGSFLEPEKPSEPTPLSILSEVVPEDRAQAFIEHRKKLRKPLSVEAARLAAGKLRELPDPVASVNQTIMNGWQGVFPVKVDNTQQRPRSKVLQEIERREAQGGRR